MKFTKTEKTLNKLGKEVVDKGRGILQSKKKTTNKNTLYNEFSYNVSSSQNSISLEWEFGKAEDYWSFVDQGVKGKGGFKGRGGARGQGSEYQFGSGKYKGTWKKFKKSIKSWIVNKGIQPRNKGGQFIKRDSFVFLIQRSVYQRGLPRTLFFTKPYENETKKYEPLITEAFADDLMNDIKTNLNTQ